MNGTVSLSTASVGLEATAMVGFDFLRSSIKFTWLLLGLYSADKLAHEEAVQNGGVCARNSMYLWVGP